MPCVVKIPVLNRDAALVRDAIVECRGWVRRQDVERSRLNPLLDRPLDSACEDLLVVAVHPEHKASVDHHSEVVQSVNRFGIIAAHVLVLTLLHKVRRVQCFESHE